jgi:hypothetical protein
VGIAAKACFSIVFIFSGVLLYHQRMSSRVACKWKLNCELFTVVSAAWSARPLNLAACSSPLLRS